MTSPSIAGRFEHWFFSGTRLTTDGWRTRLYCASTAKRGTHSVADMFSAGARAQHVLLDILLSQFPDARTIRDAYSWLDSFINHVLYNNQIWPEWVRMR